MKKRSSERRERRQTAARRKARKQGYFKTQNACSECGRRCNGGKCMWCKGEWRSCK